MDNVGDCLTCKCNSLHNLGAAMQNPLSFHLDLCICKSVWSDDRTGVWGQSRSERPFKDLKTNVRTSKNKDHKIEPCGTPHSRGAEKSEPAKLTEIVLPAKEDSNSATDTHKILATGYYNVVDI